MHVLIRDFHIIASPLRLATWINNMIKDAAKSDDSAGEPPAAAAEEKDEGNASAAAKTAAKKIVEAALRSMINDMKSQHLVLNFNLFGVADWPARGTTGGAGREERVFARVSNDFVEKRRGTTASWAFAVSTGEKLCGEQASQVGRAAAGQSRAAAFAAADHTPDECRVTSDSNS